MFMYWHLNIKTCLVLWKFTPEFKQNNLSLNFGPINKNSPTKNLCILYFYLKITISA